MYNSRGHKFETYSLGALIPAIVLTLLRLFTRYHLLHGLKIDDYCLMVATLSSFGDAIILSIEISSGLGMPVESLSMNEMETYLKCIYLSIVFYNTSMTLTKISILLGYFNLFPHPRVRLATKLALGYVICCTIFWIAVVATLCRPIALFWHKSLKGACVNTQRSWNMATTMVVLNIASDFIIIGIPMPVILSLNLAKKARFWLVVVFSLGFCVTAISITRLPVLLHSVKSTDITYDTLGTTILSTVENNVAIICAALPPLRAFVQHYFPSLMPSLEASPDSTLPHHRLHASDLSDGAVVIATSREDPESRIENCASSGEPLDEINKEGG